MLTVESGAVDNDHADEAGIIESQVQILGEPGDVAEGVLEESLFVIRSATGEAVLTDDLAKIDACEEVDVTIDGLAHDGVWTHVLDVGLNDRAALPERLNDNRLTSDGFVDQGILCQRELESVL